jgi:hypothetical protein
MMMLVFAVLFTVITGCVGHTTTEAGASPQAGCEVTGGHWHTVSQSCDKR